MLPTQARCQGDSYRLGKNCHTEGLLPGDQCIFPPAESTIDMFVVRRLHKLGWQKKKPLYACFMDLQNAYDSFNQTLAWKVLTRSAVPVPLKLLTPIRNFEDGMLPRVRTNGGEHSDRFEVTQGPRQGYVLSPLLFIVFFAFALHVVLLRSIKDETNVGDLVQIFDDLVVGTDDQHPLACVRGAVCGACCTPLRHELPPSRLRGLGKW